MFMLQSINNAAFICCTQSHQQITYFVCSELMLVLLHTTGQYYEEKHQLWHSSRDEPDMLKQCYKTSDTENAGI